MSRISQGGEVDKEMIGLTLPDSFYLQKMVYQAQAVILKAEVGTVVSQLATNMMSWEPKSGKRATCECLDVEATFWRLRWNITTNTHGKMESIFFIYYSKKKKLAFGARLFEDLFQLS